MKPPPAYLYTRGRLIALIVIVIVGFIFTVISYSHRLHTQYYLPTSQKDTYTLHHITTLADSIY